MNDSAARVPTYVFDETENSAPARVVTSTSDACASGLLTVLVTPRQGILEARSCSTSLTISTLCPDWDTGTTKLREFTKRGAWYKSSDVSMRCARMPCPVSSSQRGCSA